MKESDCHLISDYKAGSTTAPAEDKLLLTEINELSGYWKWLLELSSL
jgi:hypothetical protein